MKILYNILIFIVLLIYLFLFPIILLLYFFNVQEIISHIPPDIPKEIVGECDQ